MVPNVSELSRLLSAAVTMLAYIIPRALIRLLKLCESQCDSVLAEVSASNRSGSL